MGEDSTAPHQLHLKGDNSIRDGVVRRVREGRPHEGQLVQHGLEGISWPEDDSNAGAISPTQAVEEARARLCDGGAPNRATQTEALSEA